jgi:DNA-directed RNA polymerase beta' subunit
MNEATIRQQFGLQNQGEGLPVSDNDELLSSYVEDVLADRKLLIEGVFGFGQSVELYAPMNLERVLLNITTKFGLTKKDGTTTLTPSKVLTDIQRILAITQPYNRLWGAMLRFHFAPHKIIGEQRFTEEAWNAMVDTVILKDMKSLAQPGEYVGILAAQSIGQPATQMTLNSVDWDTEIILAKNGRITIPKIGEFIDAFMEKSPEQIQHFPNSQLYMDLKDGNDWMALSPDENGKMMWTKLEAITRHPVVNEDGTDTILEVELESGRIVKATKGKSFLTIVDGKLKETNGSDLKVGDSLPICNDMALGDLTILKELNLRELLPPTEYLYGTDMLQAKALALSGDRHWFQKHQGKVFTVPYSRSDAFREAIIDGKNTNAELMKAGYVYPKRTRPDVSQIPETIPLDKEFGYFIGAYLAEGMSNETQVNITNNDLEYIKPIEELLKKWNVGYHIVSSKREIANTGIKGTTTSLVVHSTILAKVMKTFFGRLSYEKTIPNWVLQAPDDFVKALIDAYICGDGCASKEDGTVSASSVSKPLIEGLMRLLTRYGIFSTMSSKMPEIRKFKSVSMGYHLRIPAKYSKVFTETFTLSMKRKQEVIEYWHLLMNKHRASKWEEFNETVMDKIKGIKEVKPIKTWVYDVTVYKTKNFVTGNSIACRDTFHLAGVAAKSNMTRGVPRLKELLKVTHNPKATSLTVYLKPAFRESKDRVREVGQDLELTLLRDIVNKVAVYYDPTDASTVIPEDRSLLDFYNIFEQRETAVPEGEEKPEPWSKWLLRLEFDREKMFNRSITMDDVNFVLADKFIGQVNMIYTDFNSQKLVMRIRLQAGDTTYGDDLTGLKKFQNRILNNIVIRGLPDIRAATFRKDSNRMEREGDEYKKIDQYVLDTDGSNFIEVMNHPAVDGNRLYSTNVHDIHQQLGIEAARSALYQEISGLFEEANINYRHLGLLCDWMTRIGRFMSVDRYGINKNDTGPFAKASFEETEKILLKAALFGEMDPVTGVSANIMTGQAIRGGTAYTQILLDEFALPRLMEGLPAMPEAEVEDEGPDQENIDAELYEDQNDLCAVTNLRMNVAMPTKVPLGEEEDIEITVLDENTSSV